MALVIENGTLVAGANSYATVDQLAEYAANRGIALPDDDPTLEAALIKATDYIELRSGRFRGALLEADQALSWPRAGVTVNGFTVEEDEIPLNLVEAQLVVAAQGNALDLLPPQLPGATGPVLSQRVGPVAVSYAAPGRSGLIGLEGLPVFPAAEALLYPLYLPVPPLRTYRA